MRYVFDSAFVIDRFRGDPGAIHRYGRLLEDGDEPIVTEIVVAELATSRRLISVAG